MEINLFNRKFNIKKEIFIIIMSLFVVIVGVAGYAISREQKNVIVFEAHQNSNQEENTLEAERSSDKKEIEGEEKVEGEEKIEDEEKIDVYVTGCVNNPGIVSLKKGQLINDAIVAAGGATKDADLNNINLVYKLESNVMLYIKSKDEVDGSNEQNEAGSGIRITQDSGGSVAYGESSEVSSKGKVNINKADMSQLTTLPGVGEATARDIIEYREKNGKFKTIEDIMKVPRIKEGRFNAIKDLIVVE
jgi:competence protein ComEA